VRPQLNKQFLLSGTGLLLAAGLFLAVNIISNLWFPYFRLDMTESKLFTLSDGTRNILRKLEEPITLNLYVSRKPLAEYPLLSNYAVRVRDMLREYREHADGMLTVNVIDPEPFSEAEDQAVAEGVRNVPVGGGKNQAYLGLVGVNSTDDRRAIPFLAPGKEASLEYEVTKLIYNLAYPEKRVVGILSGLPIFGEGPRPEPWSIVNTIREFFELRDLSEAPADIAEDIDVLMLIHPRDLEEDALYAIDQYALRGGKLMVFVDPLSDFDLNAPREDTSVAPEVASSLPLLFDAWGIEMLESKVAGDRDFAMRVQHRDARGLREVYYLPWLRLEQKGGTLDSEDFSTRDIKLLHLGAAGILQRKEKAADQPVASMAPIVQTSQQSTILERDLVMFQRDPGVILDAFKSEDRQLALAARLNGKVLSAFPERGDPDAGDEDEGGDEDEEDAYDDPSGHVEEGELNAIVVADTDLLQNRFWIRIRRIFDIQIPQTIANNGDFVVNSLENLSGSTDLISLRSRGEYARPFTRVDDIRREAEERFRDKEKRLKEKLEKTEERLRELQKEQNGGGKILTPEQSREIAKFKKERLKTRKELRAVQHDLHKNIESLGTRLRFINIILVPLAVALLAVLLNVLRFRRAARTAARAAAAQD